MYADSFRATRLSAALLLLGVGGGVLCLAAAELPSALTAGLVMLCFSLLLTCVGAKARFGNSFTPLTVFFGGAALHALLGYVTAGPSIATIWISGYIMQAFDKALLIISGFLLAASTGYATSLQLPMPRLRRWCSNFDTSESRLFSYARILAILGSLVMFGTYWHLGYVPLLMDSPGHARFVREIAGTSPAALLDEWLIHRALDLLTCTIPLVLLSAAQNKHYRDWGTALFSILALLMPARRANVLSVMFAIMLIQIFQRRAVGRFLMPLVISVSVLVGSQFMYVETTPSRYFSPVEVLGTILPELRDLGWVITLFDGKWFYGLTLAPLFVISPSFLTGFYDKYRMHEIILSMIGLMKTEALGGLRITLAGESYLNFSFIGPIILGFPFGVLCGYLEVAIQRLRQKNSIGGIYIVSMCMIWLCFWLYLGGSNAGGVLRGGAAIVFLMVYLSRNRKKANVAPVKSVSR